MSAEDTNSPSTPWFDGSVATAVQKANTDGSVLMVCLVQDSIEGSDSHIFESRFTNEAVAAELAEMNLIPLRLIKDSTDGTMFGQIFPIMVVPALYLIRNGMLSDFMNSSVDPDEMLERIRKAVAGHSQIPPPPAPVTPAPAVASTPISPAVPVQPLASPAVRAQPTSAVSESVSTSVTPTPSTPVPTPAAASQVPVIASVDSSSSASTRNAPARTINQADALKELMKERKLKREKEEREAEKKRELDRRSSSKTLTEAQADLKEKQAKKLKDKIEKDKREEIEYKKRVKQALEDDKARRRAEREKAQAAIAASAAQSSPLDSPVILPSDIRAQNSGLLQARNDAAPALAFESSRLNIRLFDGSSIRNTFKATDTLEQVRSWINANQEGDENAYNIVQLIPSRTFTDESKMLRDLELCPSATLVLKRTATSSSAYGGSGDGAVPTLMGYGWSALGLAGKLASSAYNTVSHYNPLSVANAIPPSSSTGGGSSSSSSAQSARSSQTAADKKKDKETSYNGNSTSLE
ncbi:hypothetical protein EC957_004662 [Mortierella hygrophila]|uniref:UBX domain-containing protein n=1 Tax=Mortierella hygrophila TaxID=979708 RepID=A0A9P6F1P8_9FUNG|nr:hypothetical protein EC957_004662 [Mortierella hygrophila]